MKTPDLNINLLDSYLGLIKNLSHDSKLELISKLSSSLKSKSVKKEKTLKQLFGGFKSDKKAEEIISEIRESRTFNRKLNSL